MEILHDHVQLPDVELVMVLGGDGTILRAAELVREVDVPLLGVNLGHVGFLAESERADLAQTVEWIARRDYTVEERMTIDVQVWVRGQKIWHTWALNEAAIEKGNRERMLEVVTEVDERPLTLLRLRRRGAGHPHRLHRLCLLRRRARGLARGRSAGDCPYQRPRPLRQAPGGIAAVAAGSGGPDPYRCPGCALVRRPAFRGSAAGRACGSDQVRHPGAAWQDAPDAVFRPAGPQVRAPHPRLAGARAQAEATSTRDPFRSSGRPAHAAASGRVTRDPARR